MDTHTEFLHEYMWLKGATYCKDITFKRITLDNIARNHNIDPSLYKNKRLLLNAIIEYWTELFRFNPEFHIAYQRYHGVEVEL
jgi:hypothetical protein